MPIWVNGTAVVLGFILLFRIRKLGWTKQEQAFGVYLTSFAVLLIYDLGGGTSPWFLGPFLLAMVSSWIWAMVGRKPSGASGEEGGRNPY